MLWLSRKDIEHISRRLLRDYLKKVPQKVDHIDPTDFAEKMCGLQFTFADISEAHDAIGLTATSEVIITIPQRDGTRLDYELDGKTAFIDQSLVAENQIGRLNFTMMHEAAHQLFWMLYPEEYEVQTPRCVFRMADEHTQYPVLDWEEWQTNVLTSFLLLPKELVYRHMADVGLKDGIGVLNRIYARKDYECFSEAAKRLGVSKTALAIRSSQLGLVGRNDLYDPYALVDEYYNNGRLYYEILSKSYLTAFRYTESELLEILNLERSTFYDRKKEAVMLLGIALWGYAIPVFRGIFDVEGDESEIPEFFTGTEKSDLCPTKVR